MTTTLVECLNLVTKQLLCYTQLIIVVLNKIASQALE